MSLASELNISFANTITFPIDGDVDNNAQSQELGFLQAHLLSTFSESFYCWHTSKHWSLWRKKESTTKFFQVKKKSCSSHNWQYYFNIVWKTAIFIIYLECNSNELAIFIDKKKSAIIIPCFQQQMFTLTSRVQLKKRQRKGDRTSALYFMPNSSLPH